MHQLVLRQGRIMDPATGLDAVGDVAIDDGRITAIGDVAGGAADEIDAGGSLVIPGMVDIHGHYFYGGHPAGIPPDVACIPFGVTTTVDAGSTGWANFGGLKDSVLGRHATSVYAFLHISGAGLLLPLVANQGELADLSHVRPDETVACTTNNRDHIVGLKVRIDEGACGLTDALEILDVARQIANAADTRLMVHVTSTPDSISAVLSRLLPGDIVTHIFHGGTHGILAPDGQLFDAVRDAQAKGIIFDVGYGGTPSLHFSPSVAQTALEQGFRPDTLSTDRFLPPLGRRSHNLLTVMEEFLALGMTISEVVASVTSRPADAIGKGGLHGSLDVGRIADIAILRFDEDANALLSDWVIKAGSILWSSEKDRQVAADRVGIFKSPAT